MSLLPLREMAFGITPVHECRRVFLTKGCVVCRRKFFFAALRQRPAAGKKIETSRRVVTD